MNKHLQTLPKPFLIGIAGRIGSGKDTVASLVRDRFAREVYTTSVFNVAFANELKAEVAEFLALLRQVPYARFSRLSDADLTQVATQIIEEAVASESSYKMFNAWLSTAKAHQLPPPAPTPVNLEKVRFQEVLLHGSQEEKKPYRRLLQLWGTEFRRHYSGSNYWLDAHMQKTFECPYLHPCHRCIVTVPDVRFPNEAAYIVNTWGGAIIHVQRPLQIADATELAHISEAWVPDRETYGDAIFDIDNDGDLNDLITKVHETLEQIRVQYFEQQES